jgi:hypothetical protein
MIRARLVRKLRIVSRTFMGIENYKLKIEN